MSQSHEFYRYAAPGERQLKYHHGTRQQVRYLPGVELRSGAQQRLRVVVVGNSHIYQTVSEQIMHFNLADRLASLSGIVDEEGMLVSREIWYPFGGTASWLTGAQAGAALKFQRYAGKERDATGLIYFGWRCYVPWKMRWLNCDPAGTIDGLNLFCMVSNNPLTLRDRDGRVGENEPLNLSMGGGLGATNPGDRSLPPIKRYLRMLAISQPPQAEAIPLSDPIPRPPVAPVTEDRPETLQPGTSTDSKTKNKSWCRKCVPPKSFSSYNKRNLHLLQVHNIGFECKHEGCGKIFSDKQLYESHINVHAGDKPYICEMEGCDSRFFSMSDLCHHKHTHAETGEFNCTKCVKKFKTSRTLAAHNRYIHGMNEKRRPCNENGCNVVSYTLTQYKRHEKSHRSSVRH
ncbi:putative insecticidal toxin protein [Pantoea sp. AS-PWVM4]|uniref:RHS repeat-associated core domain-containing protein n=1 Tax=Pantoea sp. AS-PWVM4 TaxID=1332069 RepID=UPI0003AC7713|nr:RHS repeat-associated core domain-containing protein [Pantoea sp. AS-PWVM4]ERK09485.1 putative insecticidal toxin protein [Pantoea sp. AS-PWVM4]